MRICVAQTRPVKGDVLQNIEGHKRFIAQSIAQGADLIIFPELSITGYEPELAEALATTKDDSRFDAFQKIADAQQITIGVGMPLKNATGIAISMVLFQPHKERSVYAKKYIHADEEPYFISGQDSPGLLGENSNIALAICYELSVPEHAENAFKSGATIYIASAVKTPPQVVRTVERLSAIAVQYSMTVFLSNCVGLSEGNICGGKSSVWNSKGELLGQLDNTQEGILVFDTDTRELREQTV